jgi:UDP-GlcNAc:undecaprenyl-phosphate GlcNAc-1-phosphate transferase
MGLVDDRRGLSAVFKLAVEIVLASVVVACGIRASMFIGDNPITWALSVLWIVGITNSFNLLDNMDGLSAGIAAIVGCILLVVALQCSPPHLFLAALLVVLLGAVTGFLVFNFPPASIFMGDCGSLFIGFMLAVASIQFTYVWPGLPTAKRLIPLAVPLLIFSVPIYDTASVVWIRIREGRHPFQPDKKHFSHRLLDLGMTRREALLTIYLVAFAIGVSATLLYSLEIPGAIVVLAQALGILSIIVLLEHTGLRRNHR